MSEMGADLTGGECVAEEPWAGGGHPSRPRGPRAASAPCVLAQAGDTARSASLCWPTVTETPSSQTVYAVLDFTPHTLPWALPLRALLSQGRAPTSPLSARGPVQPPTDCGPVPPTTPAPSPQQPRPRPPRPCPPPRLWPHLPGSPHALPQAEVQQDDDQQQAGCELPARGAQVVQAAALVQVQHPAPAGGGGPGAPPPPAHDPPGQRVGREPPCPSPQQRGPAASPEAPPGRP